MKRTNTVIHNNHYLLLKPKDRRLESAIFVYFVFCNEMHCAADINPANRCVQMLVSEDPVKTQKVRCIDVCVEMLTVLDNMLSADGTLGLMERSVNKAN